MHNLCFVLIFISKLWCFNDCDVMKDLNSIDLAIKIIELINQLQIIIYYYVFFNMSGF